MEPRFHVVLDGRKMGPYDRRTIVGMRVRNTLSGDHVLVGTDGQELTVRELVRRDRKPRGAAARAAPVQAVYPGKVRAADDKRVPAFNGEVEIHVQPDVLRIAGQYRRRGAWREGRIKVPLQNIVHAGSVGHEVELGLRAGDDGLQRLRLDLLTPLAADALVAALPGAEPWPEPLATREGEAATVQAMWMAVAGAVMGAMAAAGVLFAQSLH